MRKTVIGILALCLCLILTGCAAKLSTVQKQVTVAGTTTDYVFATGRDNNGGSFSVMDRYDPKGQLVAKDAGTNPGILPALLNGAAGSAVMAGGIMGGAALLRPSNVSQTGGGASQTQGQAASSVNVNKNINRQAQGQGQAQGQLQGQIQGQGQAQGQNQSLF